MASRSVHTLSLLSASPGSVTVTLLAACAPAPPPRPTARSSETVRTESDMVVPLGVVVPGGNGKARRFLSRQRRRRDPALHCWHAHAAVADHRALARLARRADGGPAAPDRSRLRRAASHGLAAPARGGRAHAQPHRAGARGVPAPVPERRRLARSRALLRARRPAHAQRAGRSRPRPAGRETRRRRAARHPDRGGGRRRRRQRRSSRPASGTATAGSRGRAHRQDHRAHLFRRPEPRRGGARARGVRADGGPRPALRPRLAAARTGDLTTPHEPGRAAEGVVRRCGGAAAGGARCVPRTRLRHGCGLARRARGAHRLRRRHARAARVAAAAAAQFDATAPWLGRRIGNYRIVGELGQGGMGSVYLAERADREYQARVAIKLIRGFPTQAALERLRRERQVLAGLVHPNIARLLDGGTTPEGQPYLVMEYVEGRPLMQWWAERRPPLALRLRLFQQLCLAVHHAHQNLIVHRDLKPGNVLVRADDTPVLLDFGIAKLIAPEADGERATELRAFTPDYASPEQVSGGPVTTASDVYALGLILYELLCGKPYKSGGRTTSWRASRPARVAEAADAPWLRAEAAAIGGDLEHVVRRALAEEPARRYSSAA